MNFSTYRFTLDLQKHQSQMSIAAFQYDTAIKLSIGLTDGGIPYYLEDGCIAVLWGTKANGEPIAHKCSIEGNTRIIYEFNRETANVIGVVDCQIRLYKDGEEKISAPKFIIVVGERVVNDADVFDAGDGTFEEQFSALDAILTKESGRVTAENARVEAEKERAGNELLRKAAEDTRITFENQRQTEEAKRVKAETERQKGYAQLDTKIKGKVDKTFVEGLVNPLTEKQSVLEKKVYQLETLSLTHIEDTSPSYLTWTKVSPVGIGSPAFIKRIEGSTERVAHYTSKNLVNPKEITSQFDSDVEGAGEDYFSYVLNEDGSITYTTNTGVLGNPDPEFSINIEALPMGVYFLYLEGAKSWYFDGVSLNINYGPDWDDNIGEWGDYVKTTRTLKVMLYFRENADFWDVMDTMYDPQGPAAYEPYKEPTYSLEHQKTARIASYTANLFGGSALKRAILDAYPDKAVVDEINKTITLPRGMYDIPVPQSVSRLDGPSVCFIVKGQGHFEWSADNATLEIYNSASPETHLSTWSGGYPIFFVSLNATSQCTLYYEECGTFIQSLSGDIPNISDVSDFQPYSEEPIGEFLVPEGYGLGVGISGYFNGNYVNYRNSLEWKGNRFTATNKSREIVLDGTEAWYENAGQSGKPKYFYSPELLADFPCVPYTLICDLYTQTSVSVTNDNVGINTGSVGGRANTVVIRPENATNMSVADFKAQLAENPIRFVYALATPDIVESKDIEDIPNEISTCPYSVFRFFDNNDKEITVENTIAYVVRKGDKNYANGE